MRIPLPAPESLTGDVADVYNALTNQALQQRRQDLENQYFGPQKESEMAYRNALTQGQNITNKYSPQKFESELKSAEVANQKNEIIQDFLRQLFKKNQMADNNELNMIASNNQNNNATMGQNPFSASNVQPNKENPKTNALSYPQITLLSHLMGIKEPQIVDVGGKKIAISPWGNTVVAEGPNEKQKSQQAEMGKYTGKFYGNAVDAYKTLEDQGVALNQLVNLMNNPEFQNVTGPIGAVFKRYTGTPEQQQLLGKLATSSGEIALQIAPALKGAFTGRDQTLINSIKANPNDPADVFRGKLSAQILITNVLKERSRLMANYIENGMSPIEATKIATEQTPLDKYRKEIKNLIKGNNKNIQKYSEEDINYTAKKHNISPQEVKRRLGIA